MFYVKYTSLKKLSSQEVVLIKTMDLRGKINQITHCWFTYFKLQMFDYI